MVVVESAGITDRGRKREENEDHLFFDDTLGLYLVADGMGGHKAGEIASKLVVNTIRDYVRHSNCDYNSEDTIAHDATLSPEANRLLSGIQLSNSLVHQASLDNKAYRGMGSTVSAVYFSDNTFIAANVGDSPIYLVRDGKIKLVSVPHTVLAEQTALNPENAEKLGLEFRHMLTRAMGTEASVRADLYEIQCFKDDILVISTDGLSDKASPEEIMGMVYHHGLNTACRRLVELANERGGDDNVTAIVLKVKMVKNSHRKLQRLTAMVKKNISNFSRVIKCQH